MEINPRLAFAPIAQEPKQLLKAIKGYEKEPLLSLEKACQPLHEILDELNENIIIAKNNSKYPSDGLTPDESASIHLYTMEWDVSKNSLYAVLNRTLRTPERQVLKPWFRYLKLFLTALFKLPSVEGQLWRGVKEDLSEVYPKGEFQIWWSFSSCTSSLEVLQQPQFVGKSGIRTLFSIEGVTNGKNISRHSYFKKEDEILLLPGTSLEVRSLIHRSDGFHLVHLRKVKAPYELLVSPFDDVPVQFNPSQTFVQPRTNFTRMLKPKQYDSDDDSSADEGMSPSNQNLKFERTLDKTSDVDRSSCSGFPKSNTSLQPPINGKSETKRIPKLQTQKNTTGNIEINYVDRMGNYVVIQNTSASNKKDQDMTGWLIKKTIDMNSNNKFVYEFPDNFILKSRVPVRILARNTSKKSLATTPRDGMISLVADNIVTWGIGTTMITQLFDDEGEQQAIYTQTFV